MAETQYFEDEKVVVELLQTFNTKPVGTKIEVPVSIANTLLQGTPPPDLTERELMDWVGKPMAKRCPKGTKPDPVVRKAWKEGQLSPTKTAEMQDMVAVALATIKANEQAQADAAN